jgi:hypothetical protein
MKLNKNGRLSEIYSILAYFPKKVNFKRWATQPETLTGTALAGLEFEI